MAIELEIVKANSFQFVQTLLFAVFFPFFFRQQKKQHPSLIISVVYLGARDVRTGRRKKKQNPLRVRKQAQTQSHKLAPSLREHDRHEKVSKVGMGRGRKMHNENNETKKKH